MGFAFSTYFTFTFGWINDQVELTGHLINQIKPVFYAIIMSNVPQCSWSESEVSECVLRTCFCYFADCWHQVLSQRQDIVLEKPHSNSSR